MSTLKDKEVRERLGKEIDFICDHWVEHDNKAPYQFGGWRGEFIETLFEIIQAEITKARESSEAQGARNMLELFDEYQDRYSVKEIIKLGKSIFALSSINEKE